MRRTNRLKVTRSSGNVFRDLGFPTEEAEHLLIRADLLIQLQKAIAARDLTQAKAATILRVTQPRVSDLLRGRLDLFSTDTLIDMLARLGVHVRFVLKFPTSIESRLTPPSRRSFSGPPRTISSLPRRAGRDRLLPRVVMCPLLIDARPTSARLR
jgi:predicted XRE-type DNA-binding protein